MKLLHCCEVIRAVTLKVSALLLVYQGGNSEGYCIVVRAVQ